MKQITWGHNKDKARLEHLLHEALTETTYSTADHVIIVVATTRHNVQWSH